MAKGGTGSAAGGGYSNISSNNLTNVFVDQEGNAKGEIEQGPAMIRVAAFAASIGSIVCLVLHAADVINVFHPVRCILHVYLGLFALTCILFEAPPEYVEKVNGANGYLELLIKHCGFLSNNAGRGLFYIFQATLWMSFYDGDSLMVLAMAAALTAVGVLSILMHFGILPQHIAAKTLHHVEMIAGRDLDNDGRVGKA
eukprot:CAMPEP_0204604352 /NCGR_PEP_ID=MMETSP0661-20131031/57809_1 /ASSEMBLY_ACC=CAM_ASM_000606 /TAXON_ID=109239 /ORGANISM="Alexandrium margalefi, Strain AMGDE01CS-322" /LENGTH=197 /DNA_ID=CAMNT_0051615499 /DNA_START=58 /DNA_END=651 /DNA_ORIENTATION=-